MTALDTYKNDDFTVEWAINTEATSGVATYTVQYKENVSGTWTDWFTNVSYTVTSATWQIDNTTEGCTVYFRALSVDNASNCGSFSSNVSTIKDTIAPISNVGAISPYSQNTTPVNITVTGSEATSGVKNVTLYYYYSNDNFSSNSSGPFVYDVNSTLPWTTFFYSFLANESGFYRFYSRAIDNATNVEDEPDDNDTMCYCNVPPYAPSDPYPENVTGVNTFNTTVTLSVNVTDPDFDDMTIYFYNNAKKQEIGNTSI